MICTGCGNTAATVLRIWHDKKEGIVEVCDAKECGNLKTPWVPDVFFDGPGVVEHLADEKEPFGKFISSKRHKAQVLREQGLIERGDRVHGSDFVGVRNKKLAPKFTPGFKAKLDSTIRKNIRLMRNK